jgi:hypothetical protein
MDISNRPDWVSSNEVADLRTRLASLEGVVGVLMAAVTAMVVPKPNQADKADWASITKITTLNVDAVFNQEYNYDGALQGKLVTWYKESNYFNLRELSSNDLIKCFYESEMYGSIYRLFEDKDAVVNLSGAIKAARSTGKIKEVRVHGAKAYPRLTDSEFDRLFGLFPDITGDISISDFINKMRNGDSEDIHEAFGALMSSTQKDRQIERFRETARAIGCDQDKERFEAVLGKIMVVSPTLKKTPGFFDEKPEIDKKTSAIMAENSRQLNLITKMSL